MLDIMDSYAWYGIQLGKQLVIKGSIWLAGLRNFICELKDKWLPNVKGFILRIKQGLL